jgi:hypothetical protein
MEVGQGFFFFPKKSFFFSFLGIIFPILSIRGREIEQVFILFI